MVLYTYIICTFPPVAMTLCGCTTRVHLQIYSNLSSQMMCMYYRYYDIFIAQVLKLLWVLGVSGVSFHPPTHPSLSLNARSWGLIAGATNTYPKKFAHMN